MKGEAMIGFASHMRREIGCSRLRLTMTLGTLLLVLYLIACIARANRPQMRDPSSDLSRCTRLECQLDPLYY